MALEEIPFPMNSTIKTPRSFFVIVSKVSSLIDLTIAFSLYVNSFYSLAIKPSRFI
jgi:hypothetical protein